MENRALSGRPPPHDKDLLRPEGLWELLRAFGHFPSRAWSAERSAEAGNGREAARAQRHAAYGLYTVYSQHICSCCVYLEGRRHGSQLGAGGPDTHVVVYNTPRNTEPDGSELLVLYSGVITVCIQRQTDGGGEGEHSLMVPIDT